MARQREPAEAAEAPIVRLIDKLMEGTRAKDLDALRKVYATDMVSFDVEPPLQHLAVEAKLENWAKVFTTFQQVNYEIRDLTLVVDDALAFGHGFGRLSGRLESGSAASGIWVRTTFCFRKIDNEWVVVHDHVSVPLDMSSGRGLTDLQP